MFNHKKTAAFILGLLLCTSAAAPLSGMYACAEPATEAATEAETEAAESESPVYSEDSVKSGDFVYLPLEDDEISIVGYTGTATAVDIPAQLDGKTVTALGSKAFAGTSGITSINLPATVKNVEECFSVCTSLESITVDAANEIFYTEDGILYSQSGESGAIIHCYPQMKKDSSFTVPEDVEFIGTAAFYNTKLSEIKLHAGISSIYRHAFASNLSLKAIDMSICTEISAIDDMAFAYCSALTDVKLPPNVLEICAGVFAACESLETIELPEKLEAVGQNAFAGTAMKKVTIPSNVSVIGYCAFGYDINLQPIEDFIVVGATGTAAETYCTEVDEEYEYANNFTFYDVSDAEMIEELDGLEQLQYGDYIYAVDNGEVWILMCNSAENIIEIPADIEGIPVTRIYGGAFFQSGAVEIIIPDSVKTIDSLAFYYCALLNSVTLPDGIEAINDRAFSNCTGLTSIIIPEGCKSIGSEAFSGCSSLSSVTIPQSCETIGANAFFNCSSIETIAIPAGCTSIGNDAFYGCNSLKEFTVSGEGEGAYIAEDGILFGKDKTTLVAYPPMKAGESYTPPSSVQTIGVSAFAGCNLLKTVDLSEVVTIDDFAFEYCESLSSVNLSKNLLKIGDRSFYGCTSLKNVRTYNKIEEIGSYAFGYYFDSSTSSDAKIDGFTIYAELGSGGAGYATNNEITCENDTSKYTPAVIEDSPETVKIFGAEVEKNFLYVVGGIAGAAILAGVGIFTGKKIKKNKAEKELKHKKEEIEKKLAAKKEKESENGKESDNENK